MSYIVHAKPIGFVKSLEDGTNCCDCGWPIKHASTALFSHRDEQGGKKYKHCRCPGSKERAKMRAEALNNA